MQNYEIKMGKLENVKLYGDGTLEGQLSDNDRVAFSKRAVWSWLRLHLGRKQADDLLRGQGDTVFNTFVLKFSELRAKQRGDVQFIIESVRHEKDKITKRVLENVATVDHKTISEEEVYEVADKIISEQGYSLTKEEKLLGRVYYFKEVSGYKIGFQVFGGTITTTRAISIGGIIRVVGNKVGGLYVGCMNPVSFLGIKRKFDQFARFGIESLVKVLRYETRTQIASRIQEAIRSQEDFAVKVEDAIQKSKDEKYAGLDLNEAKALLTVVGDAYNVGQRAIIRSYLRYAKRERHQTGDTLYGLSMATSWVTQHVDRVFKKTSEGGSQSLATVSGIFLVMANKEEVIKKCRELIRERPNLGELYGRLEEESGEKVVA